HPAERTRDLPYLLDAELPDLGGVAVEIEVRPGDPGQVPLGALGQHGDLGVQLDARLERPELLAVAPAALVAGHHAENAAAVHDELLGVGLGEEVGAGLLGLLA